MSLSWSGSRGLKIRQSTRADKITRTNCRTPPSGKPPACRRWSRPIPAARPLHRLCAPCGMPTPKFPGPAAAIGSLCQNMLPKNGWGHPLRLHRRVWRAFGNKAVVHPYQDDRAEAHEICQLQGDVCNRSAFPHPPPHIAREFWRSVRSVQEVRIGVHSHPFA